MYTISEYATKLDPFGNVYLDVIRSLPYDTRKVTNPKKVTDFLNKYFDFINRAEEYSFILAVNTKTMVIGVFEVFHGTANLTLVHPREILMRALLLGATGIIFIHNHPSKDSTPSSEDIRSTKRLKKACKLIGIDLIDSIIVADNFFSLRENNLL